MSNFEGSPFEMSTAQTALHYAKQALGEVGELAKKVTRINNCLWGERGLIFIVNHNAKLQKKLQDDLEKEVAALRAELQEVRLSAIVSNPIMYDEATRKAAQVELQAIMDAKAAVHEKEGTTL